MFLTKLMKLIYSILTSDFDSKFFKTFTCINQLKNMLQKPGITTYAGLRTKKECPVALQLQQQNWQFPLAWILFFRLSFS